MATSPIYSWPEPDNTDLVKNGALAIRTLGNAIDTTMATMVPKSIVDAKGDLIAGTAADTAARLAVGNNGETLVADSSTATGLRYTAGNPIPNPVLNSAFQIAQRGTSISTASAGYTLDRWYAFAASAGTVSRQATGDTTNLPFIQYALRFQRTNGSTSTTDLVLSQSFETLNSIPYAGKTVTLSFYARAGANYSATSNALNARLWSGTGTDQNIAGTYTGATYNLNGTATLTTTWQRFTITGSVASTATEIAIQIFGTPTGTAGAADYFEVTGVQIDIGSVALPFRTNGGTIQKELSAAQRYYQRIAGGNDIVGSGQWTGSTTALIVVPNKVTMRTAPAISGTVTNLNVTNVTGGAIVATAVSGVVTGVTNQLISITTASGGNTGGGTTCFTNGANGILEMSSEL